MFKYEYNSQYVEDEIGALYLCPWGEFQEGRATRAELMRRCIDDEANIHMHAFEGR